MMNTTLEFWDSSRSYLWPNIDAEIQNLTYSSIIYGGFATFSCDLYRPTWKYYPEFALNNSVIVRSRHQVVWQGKMSAPGHDTTDLKLALKADGPVERLKTRLTQASLDISEKGSTWMTDHLITDTDLAYLAGMIYTGDFPFPAGIDALPEQWYSAMVESINKCNGYRYGFFTPPCSNQVGNRFDFWPVSSTPDYYLDIEDCDTKIEYTTEGIENALHVKYTPDGGEYRYFWYPNTDMVNFTGTVVPDATSAGLYGRRDGILEVPGKATLAQAAQFASVTLAWEKTLRPASDVVARKITDSTGAVVPNPEAQAGKILHIRGLNPGEFSLLTAQSVNELSTWPVVMSTVNIDVDTVTLSPGGLASNLDNMLAQIDAVPR